MFFSFFMFAPVRDAGLRIAVAVFAADEASMVRLNDGLRPKCDERVNSALEWEGLIAGGCQAPAASARVSGNSLLVTQIRTSS